MNTVDTNTSQHWDKLWIHANLATMVGNNYGVIKDGALAVRDGKIVWLGKTSELIHHQVDVVYDLSGKWITPGLIDCHTHIIYAGNRSNEFEARLKGVSYSDIAAQGGGILATVKATRQATEEMLFEQALPRLQRLCQEGITTIEIKSGYGLDLDSERKMLRIARRLGESFDIDVLTTYLAAHTLPPEYQQRSNDYIDAVCEWMVILANEGLIDAVDGFCEHLAFTPAQIERVFKQAQALHLPIKLHAEQLSNQGGATLVAAYDGLSADHLEYLDEAGIRMMAKHQTTAVILPGAFYTLRETQYPPIDSLRAHNVNIALATDCNPGTSPLTSLLLTMNMACTLFSLTPAEALAGVTTNAASALGLANTRGKLALGYQADLAIWDIDRPADLSYQIGFNPLFQRIKKGKII